MNTRQKAHAVYKSNRNAQKDLNPSTIINSDDTCTMRNAATALHKRISFKKSERQPTRVENETAPTRPSSVQVAKNKDSQTNCVPIKQPDEGQSFIKVKRKSITKYRSNKRKYSVSSTCDDFGSKSDNNIIQEINNFSPSRQSQNCVKKLTCLDSTNDADGFEDFWNDDQLFADFDLSNVMTSSPASTKLVSNVNSSLHHHEKQMTSSDKEMFYGLPLEVKHMFLEYRGIANLYDWQIKCLNLSAIKDGKNLIYSLPTSGGKTLVSEILLLRELLINKKDVIFVVPFVSIVQEKVRSLAQFAVDLDFVIDEYAASKGKFPPQKRKKKKTLYIATIEKANGLVNSFIEEKRIDCLGLVVVDELHMLGEGGRRGSTLEMCLTKLLYYVAGHVQVIGMSATLNNIKELQQFLKAEVYTNDFRPVKLHEYVKIGNAIYQVGDVGNLETSLSNKPVRHTQAVKKKTKKSLRDPDNLVQLVTEVIPKNSCLVFCSTKRNCENVAKLLIELMPREFCQINVEERKGLLKALYNQANGVCPVLKRTIPFGIAYHHSGLTADERKLIELSYSKGVLCVLTCTSTLAAGVNLPAKRVILRAPYIGMNVISRSQYKQMIGRAGRAGIDTSGESILIIKETDKSKVGNLFSGPFDSCTSSLSYQDNKGVRILILNLLGLQLCSTEIELVSIIKSTLLAIQTDRELFAQECTLKAIHTLESLGLVKLTTTISGDATVEVTKLGNASFKGGLDVDIAPLIYEKLDRALECMVLVNELHLLYLVTPLDMSIQGEPDWMVYQKQVVLFDTKEKKVATAIGISEPYLLGKAYGQKLVKIQNEADVKRFYMTLMLYKLIQGCSIWKVANLFNVPRGFLQNLLTSSASYAFCLVHFTEELPEFWAFKILFENIVKKLTFTSSLELVPLMEISGVKQGRARQFFTAGYHSLYDVAHASPDSLGNQIEHLYKTQAKQIVSAAKMLLKEKADALREEAEELVSNQPL